MDGIEMGESECCIVQIYFVTQIHYTI